MGSSTTNNVAIWVNAEANLEIKHFDRLPEPGNAETLVEVHYSGINPADVKHGRLLGIRSTVAGYDFSGKVVQAGPGSEYRAGDWIAGCAPASIGRPAEYGTHQNYLIATDLLSFPISENLPLDHAACLGVSARTAADAFFNLLQYPLPGEASPEIEQPPLLVWGGASSLGFITIQFAKAIGVRHIFTTASPENHADLKELGATHTFDYKDPDVVSKIRDTAAKADLSLERIFDAVGNPQQKTADTAVQCGTESPIFVSSTVHPRAQMPIATAELPFKIQLPGTDKIITPPVRPEAGPRIAKALEWIRRSYGNQFRIPKVEVVGGNVQENLKYLQEKCAQGAKFRKVCFKHPFEA
ncbi:putative secondary metabolism biosynthetic enzyme [Botryosphaeria dothidea]